MITIKTDGGSRGNPGPSAYGFVFTDGEKIVLRGKGFLGNQTNNYAEYQGVIEGMKKALDLDHQDVLVMTDSKLVVEQLNGRWAVKSRNLQPLFKQAKGLIRRFSFFRILHIPRHLNIDADRLVNKALDMEVISE